MAATVSSRAVTLATVVKLYWRGNVNHRESRQSRMNWARKPRNKEMWGDEMKVP